ncbi:uncharacterized protein [Heterodontus francisci]|uniref:uncharacterized protein n=1 Tax=Heterodontus francisci TaxID=7792 RepID=UPI00355B3CCF
MRGTRGSSPRYGGRREQIDDLARGGDVDSLEYEEDNELPDLIMNIDNDVLEDRDEDTESKDASVGYKRTQTIFMVLAVLGFVACIVLLCLVAYFATTYVNASGNLQVARDSLQNTTESYLKLQQQAKQREEAHCTQFRNSTEHWLHLFCEKYECPSRICDPGWLLNSRNCYLFTNTRLTWEQSRALCLNRHGHLAIASNSKVQVLWYEQLDVVCCYVFAPRL